jgi:hypothetical protein
LLDIQLRLPAWPALTIYTNKQEVLMKDSKKMLKGLAAFGAVVGTGLMISKIRDNHKSGFEKFIDQLEHWTK